MEPTTVLEDDFTPVTHKKARAPKKRKGQQKPRERTLSERVDARRKALGESGYPERCRGKVLPLIRLARAEQCTAALLRSALADTGAGESCPPPACVVCLGLGSVAESSKSQDQLVLLQGLLKELEANVSRLSFVLASTCPILTDPTPYQLECPTEVYDPVTSPEDTLYLSEAGFKVLNSEVRRFDLAKATAMLTGLPLRPTMA